MPVGAVLLLLLASADVVLAGAVAHLRIDAIAVDDGLAAAVRFGLIAAVLGGIAAAAGRTDSRASADRRRADRRARHVEATTVLGVVSAVLAAFTASQVAIALGGDELVRRTSGLTYAENARRGFFQLLAAAALVASVLAAVRAATVQRAAGTAGGAAPDRPPKAICALSVVVVVLTLVVVASAHRRLSLYEAAYGWTMTRVMAHAAIAWVGIALACIGLRWSGLAPARAWTVPTMLVVTMTGIGAMALADPESRVVEANLDRLARAGTPVDRRTVADVTGTDGVPADAVAGLTRRIDELPEVLVRPLCGAGRTARGITCRPAVSGTERDRQEACAGVAVARSTATTTRVGSVAA